MSPGAHCTLDLPPCNVHSPNYGPPPRVTFSTAGNAQYASLVAEITSSSFPRGNRSPHKRRHPRAPAHPRPAVSPTLIGVDDSSIPWSSSSVVRALLLDSQRPRFASLLR